MNLSSLFASILILMYGRAVHQRQDNRSTKQVGIKRQRLSSHGGDDYSAENMLHKHNMFEELDLPSKGSNLIHFASNLTSSGNKFLLKCIIC